MRPIAQMPDDLRRRIETVFSDIDDTITTDGRLGPDAFSALWRARHSGLRVVLVTGRPAGWCDHMARMWPIDGIIGENGAVAFSQRDGRIRRLYAERPDDAAAVLDRIRQQILSEMPHCRVAADQPFRQFDLAIDICEEVSPLSEDDVDRVVAIFEQHGATAKISSIHVNGWLGRFDKLTMCRRWADEVCNAPLDPERATFVGDSPNDEPMFAHFPHACGVANVRRFAARMRFLPTYVTLGEGGAGFTELIEHLVAARGPHP